MTFAPLTQLPWRRSLPSAGLPEHWIDQSVLSTDIDAWRAWLVEQSGQRWLLHRRDPGEFCAALLALWELGRVAVLAPDDRPETLQWLATQVDGVLPEVPPVPASTPTRPTQPPKSLPADALAVELYTSGSSGSPVRLSKRFDQLNAELAVHAQLWPLTSTCVISQVSHQHIYGLLAGVLHPLCSGVPFCGDTCRYPEVLIARLEEAATAQLIPSVVSSPAQLSRLPTHLGWTRLPAPRHVFSSGAPLAAEHAHHAESVLRAPVIEIYGSTETGGIAYRRQTHDQTWQPLPGVELSVQQQQLALRSAFLETPDAWWQQQDRVQPRGDGFLLLGRADRIVKVGGKRVSLDAIEQRLSEDDSVLAVRCIDLSRGDHRIAAVIALADNAIPHQHDERRELIQHLRERLASQFELVALPRYWRFVDTLPTNTQGKLDQGMIARLFADLEDSRAPRWLGEQRVGPSACTLTLEVPERLVFLDGHFDDYPLVPGVVMVQWAIELAGECFGARGDFQGLERLKFQRMLRPGMRFTLQLTRGSGFVGFSIDSRQGRHAAGKIRLLDSEAGHD